MVSIHVHQLQHIVFHTLSLALSLHSQMNQFSKLNLHASVKTHTHTLF